jgi:flavin-dependent dehydrogenase
MSDPMHACDVVIIGAGPAGVSAAVSLKDRGLRPLLVDRADRGCTFLTVGLPASIRRTPTGLSCCA